ncbi:MAG: oleate hydratase [Clostridia bacterium]|nr:oleate hydratase [Clostridia bacterium]
MTKKDMTKLFAAAAAVGAAAAAAAVAVNHKKKKKQAEELKRLPKGKNIYFLGNSVSALFGAAYLINDFGFKGDSIHIFGADKIGGSGNNEEGFVETVMPVIASENSRCLFEILKNVPSRDIGDISVKTEIENYNNAYPLSAMGRLVDGDGAAFGTADRRALVKLVKGNICGNTAIGDIFGADFFESDFYAMWQSMFAIDAETSADEFAKLMRGMLMLSPRVETCEGTLDTCINKYESIVEPLRKYLVECGVEFCENASVTDIDFDDEYKNVISFDIIEKGTLKTFYLNSGDLCFMTPFTSFDAMTTGDFNSPAPASSAKTAPLWTALAQKADGVGNPSAVAEAPTAEFTATFKSDILTSHIFDTTLNSPGTIMTFKNSNWDMSVVCPMGKYFDGQNDDTYVVTGRILNCNVEGNYVDKAAVNSSGSEMLYELVCLLGLKNDWEEIRDSVINVVTVLKPYGKSAVNAQSAGALADMFPNGSTNLAMLGEFVKSDRAKGDMEYLAYNAKNAVYGLLGRNTEPPVCRLPAFMSRRMARRIKTEF